MAPTGASGPKSLGRRPRKGLSTTKSEKIQRPQIANSAVWSLELSLFLQNQSVKDRKIEKQIVTAKSFVIFMNSNLGTILRSFLCRNQSCLCLNLSSLPLLSPLEKVVFEKNLCLTDTSVRGKKWQMALFQVGSLFIMTYFTNRRV